MTLEDVLVELCGIGEKLQGLVYSQATIMAHFNSQMPPGAKWSDEDLAASGQRLQDIVDAIGDLVNRANGE